MEKKTILTQVQADEIKAKPAREQAEFMLGLFEEGMESLEANREILEGSFAELFCLMAIEVVAAPLQTALDAQINPEIESFDDEQGREHIKSRILDSVVSRLS